MGNFKDHPDEINYSKKHHIYDQNAHIEYEKLNKLVENKNLIAQKILRDVLQKNFY